MRTLLFLLTGCYATAQSISFGVIGGARATDDINSAATSESKRYTVGPMVDIGLPFGFGIEVDALYSREGFRASGATPLATLNLDSHSNVWTVPILVKHSFGFPLVKPFVEAGYSPRFMNGSINSNGSFLASPTTFQSFNNTTNTDWATSHGIVIGGGVHLHAGALQLMPQIRYTRWNNTAISTSLPDHRTVESLQNQVDVLIGIAWKAAGR